MVRVAVVLAALLLAGCADAPEPAPVMPPERAATAVAEPPAEDLRDEATEDRVTAAQLLPAALAWADAWRDDAALVGAANDLGDEKVYAWDIEPRPLDGRDVWWTYDFVSYARGDTLTVSLLADGTARRVVADPGEPPAAPAPARPLDAERTTWSDWLATDRVPVALRDDGDADAWLEGDVLFASYRVAILGERASVELLAQRDDDRFARHFDATPWARAPPPAREEGLRATPAELLPVALAWARAWDDEARLDWVEGVVGDEGLRPNVPPPTTLDGRDRFWTFMFGRPGAHEGIALVVAADGTLVEFAGDPSMLPAEPAPERALNATEERWLALLRTEGLRDGLAASPKWLPILDERLTNVRYTFSFRGEGAALWVAAGSASGVHMSLVDASTWTVMT